MIRDVLIFQIEELWLGVPVGHVQEVVRAVAMSAVPGADVDYEGLINYRGHPVPVFDLRARLGLPPPPVALSDCLILFFGPERLLAVRADRALELAKVERSACRPVDDLALGRGVFAEALDYHDRLVLVLDPLQCRPRPRLLREEAETS